jgi:hypothetical protein
MATPFNPSTTPVNPSTTPLTDDERKELETLRSEHEEVAARDRESFNRGDIRYTKDGDYTKDGAYEDTSARTANQPTRVKEDDEPLPDTHWLVLADGRSIKSKGVMSVYDGVPVVSTHAIPEELYKDATPAHRF